MNRVPPVLKDGAAIFTLATGDRIHVYMVDDGLGVEGYVLKVLSETSPLLVRPSSSNTIDVLTPKSLAGLQEAQARVVAERNAKGRK